MSFLSQLRKKWEYISQAPRCKNCQHFRKPGLFLRNSLPIKHPPMCKAGDFIVSVDGLCSKHWPAQKDAP